MSNGKNLTTVSDPQAFWVNNGPVCHNLAELRDALNQMSDETFSYHVSREKNDFINWTRDVLGEVDLIADLRRVRTRSTTLKRLENFLARRYHL